MAQLKRKAEEDLLPREETKQQRQQLPSNKQKLEIIFFVPEDDYGYDDLDSRLQDRYAEMIQWGLAELADHIQIDPRTGKGKFYEVEDMKKMTLLEDANRNSQRDPLTFYNEKDDKDKSVFITPFISAEMLSRSEEDQLVTMKETLELAREFCKNQLLRRYGKQNAERVWMVDQSHIAALRPLVYESSHMHQCDCVMLSLIVDHARASGSSRRQSFHQGHFWTSMFAFIGDVRSMLARIDDELNWVRPGDLDNLDVELKTAPLIQLLTSAFNNGGPKNSDWLYKPLFEYTLNWLRSVAPLTRGRLTEFSTVLWRITKTIFAVSDNHAADAVRRTKEFRTTNLDKPEQWIPARKEVLVEMRRNFAFLLCPGAKEAIDVDLPEFMMIPEMKSVQPSDHAKFALEFFDHVHGIRSDKQFADLADAAQVAKLLQYTVLGMDPDGILFSASVPSSEGLHEEEEHHALAVVTTTLLWMLLADEYWPQADRVAIVSDTKNSGFFNNLVAYDKKLPFEYESSRFYKIVVPNTIRKFLVNWTQDATVKEMLPFLEWLLKKHPRYRRVQAETYLFDSPLGVIQQDAYEQDFRDANKLIVTRERKNTYKAYADQTRQVKNRSDAVDSKDNAAKRARIERSKEVPDAMMTIISSFVKGKMDMAGGTCTRAAVDLPDRREYHFADGTALIIDKQRQRQAQKDEFRGKAVDQAWCERTAKDTDIRQYLFPGYWRLLHQAAERIGVQFAKQLVVFVANVLPCDNCRANFNKQLTFNNASVMPLYRMTSPGQINKFLVHAHNEVNVENKKPTWTLERAAKDRQATDADFPGFWDLLHRAAVRAQSRHDRKFVLDLARLITQLTLELHPDWYGNLYEDLDQVEKTQDRMFEMSILIHNNLNGNKTACKMDMDKARLVYNTT
jgi:hypothetical protein